MTYINLVFYYFAAIHNRFYTQNRFSIQNCHWDFRPVPGLKLVLWWKQLALMLQDTSVCQQYFHMMSQSLSQALHRFL